MNFFRVLSIVWIGLALNAGVQGWGKIENLPNYPNRQIPVLCYHNIKPIKKRTSPEYTINAGRFYEQIKMLSDSGYTAILPDQLYEYLTSGKTLPSRSVMITFDDSHEEHFSTAAPILEHFGYRGVFFIMTVPIGKHSYLTATEIKALSDRGHVIADHTWDHTNLKNIHENEWDLQISRPKMQLEKITGRPVKFFAYPYGAWDENIIVELKKRGIKAAFQLTEKQSEKEPLYTIRRLIVAGNWTAATLYEHMKIFAKSNDNIQNIYSLKN